MLTNGESRRCVQVWRFVCQLQDVLKLHTQKSFDLEEAYHHEHQKHAPYVFDAYQAVIFRYVHICTSIFHIRT